MTPFASAVPVCYQHFNPHEREARDQNGQPVVEAVYHFNPHEREARDNGRCMKLFPQR